MGKVISELAIETVGARKPEFFRRLTQIIHDEPKGKQVRLKVKRVGDSHAFCMTINERDSLRIQRRLARGYVEYAYIDRTLPRYVKPVRQQSVNSITSLLAGYQAINGESRYVKALDAIATNIDECWYITKHRSEYGVLYSDTQVL